MLTEHLALVDHTKKIKASTMAQTAAALQKQAVRDLGPIWGVQATVDYFPDVNTIPLGYWPLIIMDKLDDPNAGGYHEDNHHQPYALILYDESWQLSTSHEMCEMLVDPYGRRLYAADSIAPKQGRVRYLVEVCDPCEDASFAYSINGIMVSDFYTPHYFDPVANPGTRYSYTGSLTRPRQVNKGGYLSWINPIDGKWYQATFFGTKISIKKLSKEIDSQGSLRGQMDRLTKNPHQLKSTVAWLKGNRKRLDATLEASDIMGSYWQEELNKWER